MCGLYICRVDCFRHPLIYWAGPSLHLGVTGSNRDRINFGGLLFCAEGPRDLEVKIKVIVCSCVGNGGGDTEE